MKFFMEMEPPTSTAQMKKVSVVHGRPVFYEPKKVRDAKAVLMRGLLQNKPDKPMEGPLYLSPVWKFSKGKNHKAGEWRVTRPDTDNLEKLLKDCMTKCGFWNDDAQVVKEHVEKCWSDKPAGILIESEVLEARR